MLVACFAIGIMLNSWGWINAGVALGIICDIIGIIKGIIEMWEQF